MSAHSPSIGAVPLGRRLRLRLGAHAVLVGVIVVVGVVATLRAPVFVSHDNLIEIFRATSTYFIIACALALLMIAGGIDFSVGATFSVGAVVACSLMTDGLIWPAAIVVGLAAGAATGLVGGALVVYFQVPPVIATLSVFFVATGMINVFVKGLIAPLPEEFLQVGQGELLGVPYLVWYAAGVGLVSWVVLEKTAFGYHLRAIGGNRDAAHASGIRVNRIQLAVYALCGSTAALAGILYAARTSAAQPEAGGYFVTLQVITAVLVGGASLSGGVGSIGGVALASLLFGEMQNALGVARFDQVWSDVFIGSILALAVALDSLRRRRRFLEGPVERAQGDVSRLELERVLSGRRRADAARVIAAITDERKRIERSLHDGAQQQLVNAALSLQLARDQLRDAPNENVARLLATSSETLRVALVELRDLSRGAYPALLSDHGLVAAVESLARRSAVPVELNADGVPRVGEYVEVAAYFLIAEALTNVLKHAEASGVTIAISHDGEQLHVTVVDDGIGSADESAGTGLRGLYDRVDAVGGRLTIASPAGGGTTIAASFPASESPA